MPQVDALSRLLPAFLLVLLRTSVFMSFMPFFGSKSFPLQFKIGFAVALAAVLTPVVYIEIPDTSIPVLVVREVVFGVVLGAVVRSLFIAVEIAGHAMSHAMGLSIITSFNPEMGQSTELARLFGMIAVLIVLATDAHHDLIYLFAKSYEWTPVGGVDLRRLILERAFADGTRVFALALKVAAPVLVGIFVGNILLGFVSKAAPQMNIFFVSLPVHIILGFLILIASLPVLVRVLSGSFGEVLHDVERIMAVSRR